MEFLYTDILIEILAISVNSIYNLISVRSTCKNWWLVSKKEYFWNRVKYHSRGLIFHSMNYIFFYTSDFSTGRYKITRLGQSTLGKAILNIEYYDIVAEVEIENEYSEYFIPRGEFLICIKEKETMIIYPHYHKLEILYISTELLPYMVASCGSYLFLDGRLSVVYDNGSYLKIFTIRENLFTNLDLIPSGDYFYLGIGHLGTFWIRWGEHETTYYLHFSTNKRIKLRYLGDRLIFRSKNYCLFMNDKINSYLVFDERSMQSIMEIPYEGEDLKYGGEDLVYLKNQIINLNTGEIIESERIIISMEIIFSYKLSSNFHKEISLTDSFSIEKLFLLLYRYTLTS